MLRAGVRTSLSVGRFIKKQEFCTPKGLPFADDKGKAHDSNVP